MFYEIMLGITLHTGIVFVKQIFPISWCTIKVGLPFCSYVMHQLVFSHQSFDTIIHSYQSMSFSCWLSLALFLLIEGKMSACCFCLPLLALFSMVTVYTVERIWYPQSLLGLDI